jgi:DNA-directed RNA polymerase sigma subunit (sigma70/sigma32)
MNLTRERVRQVETAGLAKLQAIHDVERLKDYIL